jgi:alpha-methylacyl-CoA racemase
MLAARPDAMAPGRQGLAGAAANYRCYECADGRHLAVGALEPKFQRQLHEALQLDADIDLGARDPVGLARAQAAVAEAIGARNLDDWGVALADIDACVTPVLDLSNAPNHPHMRARKVFLEVEGVVQPAPAPRFSRTPGQVQGPEPQIGEGGRDALARWRVQI